MTNKTNTDLTTFAANVQAVANANASELFYGSRAFVSSVYDAYGRDYADAGSLKSFQSRLLAAHKARLVTLRRCDNTRLMDADTAGRSTIDDNGIVMHTIAVVD